MGTQFEMFTWQRSRSRSQCSRQSARRLRSKRFMKLLPLAIFAFFIAIFIAINTYAYPGAKAEDYLQSFEVRSICETGVKTSNTTYLYADPKVRSDRGGCPDGALVAISSEYVSIPDFDAAEKNRNEIVGIRFAGSKKAQAFRIVRAIRLIVHAGAGEIRNELSPLAYARYKAQLATMTDSAPAVVTVDFFKHEVADIKSTSSHMVEIKIIATCKEKATGLLRGYSRTLAPAILDACPEAYQITFDDRSKEANPRGDYYNFIDAQDRHFNTWVVVQILSRFGNPYFEQKIPPMTLQEIRLDMTTASKENPVSVIVDAKAKVLLDVQPSISPYAL